MDKIRRPSHAGSWYTDNRMSSLSPLQFLLFFWINYITFFFILLLISAKKLEEELEGWLGATGLTKSPDVRGVIAPYITINPLILLNWLFFFLFFFIINLFFFYYFILDGKMEILDMQVTLIRAVLLLMLLEILTLQTCESESLFSILFIFGLFI